MMMIILSWVFAHYVQPLFPANESTILSCSFISCEIQKSLIYLWILCFILLFSGSFWKTSAFFLFQEWYQHGFFHEDSKFIVISHIVISHTQFIILLAVINFYFSSYLYLFTLIQTFFYFMIQYKDFWNPYLKSLSVLGGEYWNKLKQYKWQRYRL
jgi:hypothetical protein